MLLCQAKPLVLHGFISSFTSFPIHQEFQIQLIPTIDKQSLVKQICWGFWLCSTWFIVASLFIVGLLIRVHERPWSLSPCPGNQKHALDVSLSPSIERCYWFHARWYATRSTTRVNLLWQMLMRLCFISALIPSLPTCQDTSLLQQRRGAHQGHDVSKLDNSFIMISKGGQGTLPAISSVARDDQIFTLLGYSSAKQEAVHDADIFCINIFNSSCMSATSNICLDSSTYSYSSHTSMMAEKLSLSLVPPFFQIRSGPWKCESVLTSSDWRHLTKLYSIAAQHRPQGHPS